jgi:hypothetical protein
MELAMDSDASGWLWFAIEVIMPILLLAAIIYGTIQWRSRSRSRAVEQRRDDTTRKNYRRDEAAKQG